MKTLNLTIIKLTACLILGILLAYWLPIAFKVSLYSTLGLVIISGSISLKLKGRISKTFYFGLCTYLTMIGIGMVSYGLQNETLNKKHYTHISNSKDNVTLVLKVKERLNPDAFNNKYLVNVIKIDSNKTYGTLLLNIKNDSTTANLSVDTILLTETHLNTIPEPLNPYQFNYKEYLELKHVYHQIRVDVNTLKTLSNTPNSIFGYADNLRTTINDKLIKSGFKPDVLSITNAFLLGQRQDIDNRIYKNYINSGVVHILAVSGLHIGILLILLNVLLKPLLYLKHGRFLRPLIIIILLWSYALITGFSPSVTRAVTMFSIISIGMHLKRETNIYNTLVVSAFFILLFKPLFLFEVGFQMSYFAVFGIVSIQPMLYKLWKPKYVITDKLWQIFTVTLAAQIAVTPISLYYFHQFPGLFFIANLVILPFLGFIFSLGLLVIVLALINYLPNFIVEFYSLIINNLNRFTEWVGHFEDFLIKDINMSLLQVLFCYTIIICTIQFLKFKRTKWLYYSLIAIISLQLATLHIKATTANATFIIFNKSRKTIIGQKHDRALTVHHNLSPDAKSNVIKNYKIGESIDKVTTDSLQSVYSFKAQTILVIDSLGSYQNLSFKPDYVLLRNSPKVNLNRVIETLHPKQIVADASNYKSSVKRWKLSCKKQSTNFHYTNEDGAFILK